MLRQQINIKRVKENGSNLLKSNTSAQLQLNALMNFIHQENVSNGIDMALLKNSHLDRVKRSHFKAKFSVEEKESLSDLRKELFVTIGLYLIEFIRTHVTHPYVHLMHGLQSDMKNYLEMRMELIHFWLHRINCLFDNIDLAIGIENVCFMKKNRKKIRWNSMLHYIQDHIAEAESPSVIISNIKSNLLACKVDLLNSNHATNLLEIELKNIAIPAGSYTQYDDRLDKNLKRALFQAMREKLGDFETNLFETIKASVFSVFAIQEGRQQQLQPYETTKLQSMNTLSSSVVVGQGIFKRNMSNSSPYPLTPSIPATLKDSIKDDRFYPSVRPRVSGNSGIGAHTVAAALFITLSVGICIFSLILFYRAYKMRPQGTKFFNRNTTKSLENQGEGESLEMNVYTNRP